MQLSLNRARELWKRLWIGKANLTPIEDARPKILRTEDERSELLSKYLAAEVAAGGRVELHTHFDAVLAYGKKPNHILHLLLCIPTVGFWIPIWILLSMTMGIFRRTLHVDKFGWISII